MTKAYIMRSVCSMATRAHDAGTALSLGRVCQGLTPSLKGQLEDIIDSLTRFKEGLEEVLDEVGLKTCGRCGEVVDPEMMQDGCRDPDCPNQ